MASDLSIVLLSLRAAALSTVILVPVGLGLAWILARRNFRGKFVLDILVTLPLALPPVVIGYALLWSVGGSSPVGRGIESVFGSPIVFTWVAAALAGAIVSMPLAVRTFAVALSQVDPVLEGAARGLGAGPIRVFFTITLPLAYRGLLAGLLLGFVRAFSEFGATIVVAGNIPGETQTTPLAIFTRLSAGDDWGAARLAIISVGIAVLAIAAHNYMLARANNTPRRDGAGMQAGRS